MHLLFNSYRLNFIYCNLILSDTIYIIILYNGFVSPVFIDTRDSK